MNNIVMDSHFSHIYIICYINIKYLKYDKMVWQLVILWIMSSWRKSISRITKQYSDFTRREWRTRTNFDRLYILNSIRLPIYMYVHRVIVGMFWFLEIDIEWALALTHFLSHVKGSFQTEADLVSITNNFDETIVHTLFLMGRVDIGVCWVRCFPHSL